MVVDAFFSPFRDNVAKYSGRMDQSCGLRAECAKVDISRSKVVRNVIRARFVAHNCARHVLRIQR